jgi:hypothetical protein
MFTARDISPRAFHSSVVVENKLYAFSGCSNYEYDCLDELIEFDFSDFNFDYTNSIKYKNLYNNDNKLIRNRWPFPRWGSTLSVYKDNLVLFGGRNKIDFNDIWFFNLKSLEWRPVI